MGVLELINHLLNFILPALAMACVLPLCVRWMPIGRAPALGMPSQMLVLAMANFVVLLVGLWVFGRDGKMATYLVMAVVCASVQWLLLRAWRS